MSWIEHLQHIGFAILVFGPLIAIGLKMKRDAAAADPVTDMRSVPLTRLGDAARQGDDLVRVRGRAVAREPPLLAPVSGRPCVAWSLELYRDGDPDPFVTFPIDGDPFFIEDEGVRARVQPPFAVVVLAERLAGRGPGQELPAAAQELVDERWDYDDWRASPGLRWIERRIEAGDALALVGLARRETDGDGVAASYREAPSLLLLESGEGAPLSVSDHPSLLETRS